MYTLKLLTAATALVLVSQACFAESKATSAANPEAAKVVQKFYSDMETNLARNRRKSDLTEAESRALFVERDFMNALNQSGNEKLKALYALHVKTRMAANFSREMETERATGDVNRLVPKYEAFLAGLKTEIQLLEKAAQ